MTGRRTRKLLDTCRRSLVVDGVPAHCCSKSTTITHSTKLLAAKTFSSAAKCQFQTMLVLLTPQPYNYINTNGQGYFNYSTSVSQVAQYEKQQGSSIILPIASDAFVALSKLRESNAAQFHPISNPFRLDPQLEMGIDPSCISNLNVSIANSWRTDNWVGNNP